MTSTATLVKGVLGGVAKRPPYDGAALPGTEMVREAVSTDPGHVAAYARLCGFPAGDRLPASYPHLLGFPLALRLMASRAFPFPLLGLVHTKVDVVQHRPLHPADRPTVRVHAEGFAPHRRGSTFRLVTRASLADEEVWSSNSTYLCRHRRADAGPPPAASGREPSAELADPLPRQERWSLPGDLGRRYGAVSGDRNPIHLHALTARLFGFPRPIAHGMWTFARCLAHTVGDAEAVTARARFLAPVPLPGAVVLHERDGRFELREGGTGSRLHLSGTATSGCPSSGSPGPSSRSS
ncbi:MaoC family dehydratase [Streptomyces sp. TR06-5]|uniref:MaoC family dehydratase n=1 Tax=unclassified Streptomyces TaxID=2593676 RepID=UPI00399EF370